MGDFQTYVQQNFTYSVILLFIGAFFGFDFDAIKLAYHQKKLRKAFCILLEEDLNYLLDNLYSKNFQTKFWDEHKVEIAKVLPDIAAQYGQWITFVKSSLKITVETDYRPGQCQLPGMGTDNVIYSRKGVSEGQELLNLISQEQQSWTERIYTSIRNRLSYKK